MVQELVDESSCLTLRDLMINGYDLMELGITGNAIGACLNRLLTLVVDEEIPNEKAALLAAVRRMSL